MESSQPLTRYLPPILQIRVRLRRANFDFGGSSFLCFAWHAAGVASSKCDRGAVDSGRKRFATRRAASQYWELHTGSNQSIHSIVGANFREMT
jgi:hypothetical protein